MRHTPPAGQVARLTVSVADLDFTAVAKAASQQQRAQQAWPGWDLDLQTAAYWAPLLAAALLAVLSPRKLAATWLRANPEPPKLRTDAELDQLAAKALTLLRSEGIDFEHAVASILPDILTDGWAIGTQSADAAVASQAVDMGSWQPGATVVAHELAGQAGNGQGLADLLDRANIRIKSIADTTVQQLGRTLAQGLGDGQNVDGLASMIEGFLTDPSRAEMIAHTELCRATQSAAFWQYQFHRIEQLLWVTAGDDRVCPDCALNATSGPVPLGTAFPSGDVSPPIHPWDRCAIVPA